MAPEHVHCGAWLETEWWQCKHTPTAHSAVSYEQPPPGNIPAVWESVAASRTLWTSLSP